MLDDDFDKPKIENGKLKNGWKIKPLLEPSKAHLEYVKEMAAYIKANAKLTPRLKTPDGMTDEEFIFSLQAKSTQEIITKQKDPDYQRDWTAPLPDNWLANKDAKTKEELVGKRKIIGEDGDYLADFKLAELAISRPKNSVGQSELSGSSKESKLRAAHHFVVSPPAQLTDKQIESITELKYPSKGVPASIPKEEWREMSPIRAMWHWIKGNKVRSYKK